DEPLQLKVRRHRKLVLWQAISVFLFIISLVFFLLWTNKDGDRRSLNLSLMLPENTERQSFAVSPDESGIAFISETGNKYTLSVRRLDSNNTEVVPGVDDAAMPFWSPDSRFIGFVDGVSLKKVEVAGGPPQTLHTPATIRGGTWNENGMILFTEGFQTPIYQISSGGGQAKPVTVLDPALGETSHRWPYFLPDGRHFLYVIRGSKPEHRGIFVGSIDSNEKKRLLPDDSKAEYSRAGYVFFVRENNLLAQRFDAKKME